MGSAHGLIAERGPGASLPELPPWWCVALASAVGALVTGVCLVLAALSGVVVEEAVQEVERSPENTIVFPEVLRPPLPSLNALGATPTVAPAVLAPSLPGPVPMPTAPQASARTAPDAAPGAGAPGLAGLSLTGGADLLLAPPAAREPVVLDEDAVDEPPRPVGERARTYPAEALALQVEGYVRLRIRIDQQGRVQEVRVMDASPPGVFDASAVEDARRWRFVPARHQGQAVEVWATTQVDYALE